MLTPLCRHIRADETRCGSPALSGKPYCYFHNRLHLRHRRLRRSKATRERLILGPVFELVALGDRESIQLALSMVLNALASNTLDTERAATLLYCLQLASLNAAGVHPGPKASGEPGLPELGIPSS